MLIIGLFEYGFWSVCTHHRLFFCQFVLPFLNETPKLFRLEQKVRDLVKQEPGKHKGKQLEFKKCYVKIWQQMLEILKTESAVRGSVHYMPQLQLIRELDTYIDPEMQAEVFGQSGSLSAYFLMTFFNLRNEDAKKQVKEILKTRQ
jgi:hypothetical protein